MASIQVFKVLVLVSLISVAGCVKLPNFPTFFSHQDLLDQEREIENSFRKEINSWQKNNPIFYLVEKFILALPTKQMEN